MENAAQNNPLLIIIAGPNGAGKSTFYKKFIANDAILQKIPRISYDDVQSKNPEEDFISIGNKIRASISENFQKKSNFLYETTGSDSSARRIMKKAVENGYNTALIFIGIDSPELSALRVQQRVAAGGHNVLKEDIFTRYDHILQNFHKLMHLADFSIVFENSDKDGFKPLLMNGRNFRQQLGAFPDWLEKALAYDDKAQFVDSKKTEKQPLQIMLDKFKSLSERK